MIKRITGFFIIFSLLMISSPSTYGAEQPAFNLPTNPRPLQKTSVNLTQYSVVLQWDEDKTDVRGTYRLINPTTKKVKLTMGLPVTPLMIELPLTAEGLPPEKQAMEKRPALTAAVGAGEIEIRYGKTARMYLWDLTLNANEELELVLEYSLENPSTEEGLVMTGFAHGLTELWNEAPGQSIITLVFREIHPGQVVNMSPVSTQFKGNLLELSNSEDTVVSADPADEKAQWSEKLSASEKSICEIQQAAGQYHEAADLFEKCWEKAARGDKEPLRAAQAYYLEKAGRVDEASAIWQELSDENTKSPRVYWMLGQKYSGQVNRLGKLYQQVKQLQVHPLLQTWLSAQLPAARTKPSPPEMTEPDFIEDNNGLTFKCKVTDPDGDLDSIALRYRWEDEQEQEHAFTLTPFRYFHETELTIPAPQPFQRLFYEVVARDQTGLVVKSGLKETFYLNSNIPVDVFPLGGATMITGDFAPAEQAKVHNWFKSYLKIAKEVGFVPIAAKTPYFIFIGSSHDFIGQYKGPLFLHYTPAPFAADKTKIPVHRYFLSYWYGSGWNNLPDEQLLKIGDGLLLGRGFYTLSLKYLKAKDPGHFNAVLETVGQGREWDEAILELYRMSPGEIMLFSLWHSFGNNVLAVIIIIFLAWLGKSGYLVRLLNYLLPGRM